MILILLTVGIVSVYKNDIKKKEEKNVRKMYHMSA